MNKSIFSFIAFSAIGCAISLSSCNSEENIPQSPDEVIPAGYVKHHVVANVPELSRSRAYYQSFEDLWGVNAYSESNYNMGLHWAVYDEQGKVFTQGDKDVYITDWNVGNFSFETLLPEGRNFNLAVFLDKGHSESSGPSYIFDAEQKCIKYGNVGGLGDSMRSFFQSMWNGNNMKQYPASYAFEQLARCGDAWLFYGEMSAGVDHDITLKRPFVQVIVLSNGKVGEGRASLAICDQDNYSEGEIPGETYFIPNSYNFETGDVSWSSDWTVPGIDNGCNTFARNMTYFDGTTKVNYNGEKTVVGNFYIFGSSLFDSEHVYLDLMAKSGSATLKKQFVVEEWRENSRIIISPKNDGFGSGSIFETDTNLQVSVDGAFNSNEISN